MDVKLQKISIYYFLVLIPDFEIKKEIADTKLKTVRNDNFKPTNPQPPSKKLTIYYCKHCSKEYTMHPTRLAVHLYKNCPECPATIRMSVKKCNKKISESQQHKNKNSSSPNSSMNFEVSDAPDNSSCEQNLLSDMSSPHQENSRPLSSTRTMGVKNLKIIIPPIVRSGDTVSLTCLYDLEKGPLYTIKWYLNEQEFYQYVPKAEQPQNSYLIWKDMKIDVSRSDSHDVTLLNVSREMTGFYKCEITEDYPSYHTAILGGRMQVAVVPETDPVLILERHRLSSGDTLRANCTSGASYPTPNITWTINGSPRNDTMITRREILTTNRMLESTSDLELKLSSDNFQDGQLRLGCSVSIEGAYTSSTETVIIEDKPLIASITGDASPHSHRANGCDAAVWTVQSGVYLRGRQFSFAVSIILLRGLCR